MWQTAMTLPEGNRLELAKEENISQARTEAFWRPITLLTQHMEAPLRLTVVRAALMPISTVVTTPIATVVAFPLATLMAMTQPLTPPVLVAKTQRRGQRLSQPPHKVMPASRGLENAPLCNVVRQVTPR